MKNRKNIYTAVLSAALLISGGCTEEEIIQQQEAVYPEVSYSYGEEDIEQTETLEFYANSPVRLIADILSPGPVECAWYVTTYEAGNSEGTEVMVASTPAMTYIFPEVGDYGLRFEAFNEAGRAGHSWKVKASGIPLEVEFDIEPYTVIQSQVNRTLAVNVSALSGGEGLTTEWTLIAEGEETGTVISTEQSLSYTLQTPGNYTLTYEAVNTYNLTCEASWTVKVADLPLNVSFSTAGDSFYCTTGFPISITATPVTGIDGVTHSWTVDGSVVSTDATMSHTFNSAGDHSIEYSANNALGETFNHSWSVTVMEYLSGTMLFDFEGLTSKPSNFKDSFVSLADNPLKSTMNPSDKVIIVDRTDVANGYTSGYFNITEVAPANAAECATLRVKIYWGSATYYPIIRLFSPTQNDFLPSKINGQDFDINAPTTAAWRSLIYENEWNVLEYDISTKGIASFDGIEQIQPRPFVVDLSGTQSSGALSETNTRIMYYDDFEFLP